jgi:MoaA/NifB/PqqE/SkfB family radical SAM enzyme
MLRVSLYVTITKQNIDDLVDLAEYARSLGIEAQYQPVHFVGTGIEQTILTTLWPDASETARIAAAIDNLIEIAGDGSGTIGTRPDFLCQIPRFFAGRTFRPEACTVAFTDIVIDGDLQLRPCWSMSGVGSVRAAQEGTLVSLWQSPEMTAARREIREKRCPGCLYSCHLNKPHINLPHYDGARVGA